MVRSFVRLIPFAVVAALFASATARAQDLREPLNASNKVLTCSPQVLKDDSILTIGMPKKHGDFLVISGPAGTYPIYVVYPKPRWPLKPTAEAFRTLSAWTMRVRDIVGINTTIEPAFSLSGVYEIAVGSGFDTPNPVVDGWCEVNYEATDPPRNFEGTDPGPNREGAAWNKMKCSPSVLTEKSTLSIELPFPHGTYLAVVFEDNYVDRQYLVYSAAPSGPMLLDPDDFLRMRSLSLRVTDFKLRKRDGVKRIFVKPGRYLISVGDRFESDGPVYHGWCRVTYRPQRRS